MNTIWRKRVVSFLFFISLIVIISGCYGGGGGGTVPTPAPPTPPTYTPVNPGVEQPVQNNNGSLQGLVYSVDNNGNCTPAMYALVSIVELGLSTATDPSGYFKISNISPGQYTVIISIRGTVGSNTVTIEGGKTTTIDVEMYVSQYYPQEGSTGTISVFASSFYDDNGKEVGVEKIVIREDGNYNVRWVKEYYNQLIWQTYEWEQSHIPKGKYYIIEVYWFNGRYESQYLYLDTDSDSVYFW